MLGAVIHYMIHREVIMTSLPKGLGQTEENERRWYATPNARHPITEVPEPYSMELIEMMLIACEKDHNKRVDLSRLLTMLTGLTD